MARFEQLPSRIPGPVYLQPAVFPDDRGFFMETFRANELTAFGIEHDWVQDNHSRSRYGTLRGMHFTIGDGAAKLVRCGRGKIVDIVVDLRVGSPSYAQWEAFPLDDEDLRSLYVPPGFGHGFCVLSEIADVLYKQSAYYSGEVERGIAFDDPDVAIEWPVPEADRIVSDRDRTAPTLREFESQLPFRWNGA